jgi:ABC-type Fe2+-enterobactin transport system substrate-binding protein
MRQFRWIALAFSLSCIGQGAAHAQQYPLLDKLAQHVVEKYQNSSCQQLAAERGQRPTGRKEAAEQRAVEMLHSDANMRNEFMNRVAAPIANKLFECGMIP